MNIYGEIIFETLSISPIAFTEANNIIIESTPFWNFSVSVLSSQQKGKSIQRERNKERSAYYQVRANRDEIKKQQKKKETNISNDKIMAIKSKNAKK